MGLQSHGWNGNVEGQRLYCILFLLSLLLGEDTHNLKVTITILSVMSLGYGIGATLAIVLGYIFALPERSSPVLKHMADAESITVEPPLLAKLWAI